MNISNEQQQALTKAIDYWIAHWDAECPTLFGLEQSDLVAVSADFPRAFRMDREHALFACLGSLREMLYGASAVPFLDIEKTIGIDYEAAAALCSDIFNEHQNSIEHFE